MLSMEERHGSYITFGEEDICFVEQQDASPFTSESEMLLHVVFDLFREVTDIAYDGQYSDALLDDESFPHRT
jgi:hypothetical protein